VFGKLFCKVLLKKKKNNIIVFDKLLCKIDVKKAGFSKLGFALCVFGFFSSKTVKQN